MRCLHRFGLVGGIGIAAVTALTLLETEAAAPQSQVSSGSPVRPQSGPQDAGAALWHAHALRLKAVAVQQRAAAVNLLLFEEVRSMRLESQVRATQAFFDKRERRQQYLANRRRPRLDPKARAKLQNAARPKRLAKYEYDPDRGIIHWPKLLQRPEFAAGRPRLEALFALDGAARRSAEDGFRGEIEQVARQMRQQLKGMVRDVSQMEYLAAKKFLDRMAYEAQFMPQLDGLAAN